MLLKRWKRYSPTSRKARVLKAPLWHCYKICPQRFFSYESFNARKSSSFLSYDTLNSRKRRIFIRRATYKGNVQCVLNQEFPFFWFTSIRVQKRPVLVSVSAPTRLALQGSHVQRLYRKQTPLRSKSSTIKGLLYARLSSRCEAFVARNVRTIA